MGLSLPTCYARQKPRAKVLIADKVDKSLIEILSSNNLAVDYKPELQTSEIINVLSKYDVLVIRGRHRIDKSFLNQAKSCGLRVIARAGVGLDNIDVEYANKLGIKVINAPEGSTDSVAELTIGLMIIVARKLLEACNIVKKGLWRKIEGIELRDKTLSIIGLGRIGSRVAEVARALKMNVVAYDIADVSEKASRIGVRLVSNLHEALAIADIISLHVPLTPESYHMISWNEFKIMKRGVILINTSRGAVVDPQALLWALDEGIVAAAALDVLETEPPTTEVEIKLVNHPRVIVTPHIGAQTREAQARIAKILAMKILEVLEN